PWRTFLANHVNHIVAADFFVAPTPTCRLSFVLVLLAQLCARTFETFKSEFVTAADGLTSVGRPQFFRVLSGVREQSMIIRVTTTGRHQRRYDHRLRDLVQRTADVTIATNLGVPPATPVGGSAISAGALRRVLAFTEIEV